MKKEITKAIIIVVFYAVLLVILFVLMQLNAFVMLESLAFDFFHFSVSTFPVLAGVICSLAALHVIQAIYKGSFVSILSKTLTVCAGAFFIYFMALNLPALSSSRMLGFFILLATILASAYYGSSRILKDSNQITFQALAKSILLVIVAFVSSAILLAYSHESVLFANISFSGFIFAGINASFYPASFVDKPKAKKIGKWLSKDIIGKIVIGALIAFYIYYVHPILYAADPTITLISEWLFIGLVVLGSYFYIRSRVEGISAPVIVETWKKHQQELNFKTTEELTNLTENIEEFVTYGNKNYILLYLTNFLYERKVKIDDINDALDGLINHQDAKPKIFFKWDEKLINNLNMQNRNQVLLKTIKKVQKTYSEEVKSEELR